MTHFQAVRGCCVSFVFAVNAWMVAPSIAEPVTFSCVVPEGNYRVTVRLGDEKKASSTTVKSENRRLMLENVRTKPGECVTCSFLVNVRTPRISDNRNVRLKSREIGIARWDEKLSLEFSGEHPAVRSVEVEPAGKVTTIYLAGDSTVTDQAEAPWAGWGQFLPRFFQPDRVVVSNHAESGETLASFLGERRMEKVLTTLQPGDYLFIQFGHNDMKQTGEDVGAFKNYTRLLKEFIATARQHGATPVLVTPMHRTSFDANGRITESLGDYPDAMRRVAQAEEVPLVDLNAFSKKYYESLGPEATRKLFVDETHSNEAGAHEFARFIAAEIKGSDLDIAGEVVEEIQSDAAR